MTVKTGDIRITIRKKSFVDWEWKVIDFSQFPPDTIKNGICLTQRGALKKARAAVPLSVEIRS